MRIKVLHGPNLGEVGHREPDVYGRETLESIDSGIRACAGELGVYVDILQTDNESDMIRFIKDAEVHCQGMIINPAGFGYSSIALRDAVLAMGCPVIEVHLSNIHARERFRHRSVLADIAVGQICGMKGYGYVLALMALYRILMEEGR
ncbi:3-dehydroquinate dehydratase [bacterium]|nr:3-dehydroquinate dehydratase [candidate division CSSED10-310 bacterium]